MSRPWVLGTRGSLLAKTQSFQVALELEKISGKKIEFEFIKTKGDQIVDKPLWQIDGKDFFTRELDEALLNGKVDFVVHSYKDLGSDRPEGIQLGAITQRFFPEDILLIRKEVLSEKPKKLTIGTSSPRRQVNIKSSLKDFIPWDVEEVELSNLRGNVNTRIQKLHDVNEWGYDAIVLALAGLERLALLDDNQEVLKELFHDLDFMIMPIDEFPTAAAQGALAIEIGPETPKDLIETIKKLNHSETQSCVDYEKKKFASFGGGCHLAVGMTRQIVNQNSIEVVKGEHKEESIFETSVNQSAQKQNDFPSVFLGFTDLDLKTNEKEIILDELVSKKPLTFDLKASDCLVVTSKHCFHLEKQFNSKSTWVSGNKSWKRLSHLGHWVNGQSPLLTGRKGLWNYFHSKAIQLLIGAENQIIPSVLTAKGVENNTEHKEELISCYERVVSEDISAEFRAKILKTEAFFWTSYAQFQLYVKKFPEIREKSHFAAPGRTLEQLESQNISVKPILNWESLL
ncbi:MAG: hydroxymethylbilane synthase [Bacteriovoracaceae bacterium]